MAIGTCMLVGDDAALLAEAAQTPRLAWSQIGALCFQTMANGTCVLVGDDAALLAEAAALAQERLGCKVFAGRAEYLMAKHSQGTFDALPLPERCAATMHLLTDLELLAHADYFVGAPSLCSVGAPGPWTDLGLMIPCGPPQAGALERCAAA